MKMAHEIDGLPFLQMLMASMAMLNNQMVDIYNIYICIGVDYKNKVNQPHTKYGHSFWKPLVDDQNNMEFHGFSIFFS